MASTQTDLPAPGSSSALYLTHGPDSHPETLRGNSPEEQETNPYFVPLRPCAFSLKIPILASLSCCSLLGLSSLVVQLQIRAFGSDHPAPPTPISRVFLTAGTIQSDENRGPRTETTLEFRLSFRIEGHIKSFQTRKKLKDLSFSFFFLFFFNKNCYKVFLKKKKRKRKRKKEKEEKK